MKFIKRSERDMEHFKEFVEIPYALRICQDA